MPPPSRNRLKLVAVVLVLLAGAAAVLLLRRTGFDLRGFLDGVVEQAKAAGPLMFFTAMAVLPALGVPFSIFTLTAAGVFGLPLALAGSAIAVLVNHMLCYVLAARLIRPWMLRWVQARGHSVPAVPQGADVEVTLAVRLTPGPPLFVQSYLLGLAGVRFGSYMVVSFLATYAYTVGFLIFGQALLQGKSGRIILGCSVLAVVLIAVHLVRRFHAKKRGQPPAP